MKPTGSFHLPIQHREVYLRYILTVLFDKYYINFSKLSDALEFPKSYIHDIKSGRRGIGKDNADHLESFLNDLYGGLIVDEVPDTPKELLKFVDQLLIDDPKYSGK